MTNRTWFILGFILAMGLVSCRSVGEEIPPTRTATRITGTLVPYATQTPLETTPIPADSESTSVPLPTPTPQVHVVALGETMISIAFNYGITLEALQNANPEANPYALIVGDELLIPYQASSEEGSTAPAPDPEPVELSEVTCYTQASGGVWCLWTATNPPEGGTENIIVEIQLGDENNLAALVVTAPVNISKAGQRVPMGAFFSASALNGVSASSSATLTLLQALPLNNTASRYVPVILQDGKITVKSDRTSATISGNLILAENAVSESSNVWVIAAAYNANDQLIGFRRWEQETVLSVGVTLPLEMQVYSLGNEMIHNVEILLEAHE